MTTTTWSEYIDRPLNVFPHETSVNREDEWTLGGSSKMMEGEPGIIYITLSLCSNHVVITQISGGTLPFNNTENKLTIYFFSQLILSLDSMLTMA